MSPVLTALMIPFLGTALGSAFVFYMKRDMPALLQKALLGFAIQNVPEGAIISMPLRAEGNSRWRANRI